MIRMGIGYDVHAVTKGRPLMLGCVHFADAPVGLAGHSDADVVSHAVCDALLGAAALGDIGEHFPDSDPRWKDAAGSVFLARAAELLRGLGYAIVNVDCTVLADVVRLGDRKREMAAEMARHLGIATNQVSVKATTFEGKGAIGRGEAIACEAVAVIERDASDERMGEWRESAL
ncbi:MAG TPA: 2-C-methyl-D-erythritol 2,4-cyclodiphosphate synthase [Candidatus Krumholzibacteria bacterium]|nr:2-C-methyl-D-erythritol 2,4-cyclodiphosphate synthase [Candidatus Krumholzibacteria bacterium]